MSIRVYGVDQNPAIDRFLYRCSCSSGESSISTGNAKLITDGDGRRAIQLLPAQEISAWPGTSDGSLGIGNLIPFGRSQNPLLAPQKLHYEIPHAGERTCFARHRRRAIHVSSRSLFSHQVLPLAPAAAVQLLA
jgi:hypothetical protein